MEKEAITKSSMAERLRQALGLRHICAAELCNRIGVSKSTMSYYLKGRFKPKYEIAFQIAQALEVNPAWLMGYDDNMFGTAPVKSDSIDGRTLRENLGVLIKEDPCLVGEILNHVADICKIVSSMGIDSKDNEALKLFHSLSPDNQALVVSIMKQMVANSGKTEVTGEGGGA